MKAAVVRETGNAPGYFDFDEPVPSAGEVRIHVTASALTNFVKLRALGKHYSFNAKPPFVVGIDGVGTLDDGQRIYFLFPRAPFGGMAERTVVSRARCLAMHDTSEKGVFGDDNRFVSSGCIRVQNVRDYVQWLLKDTPGWDRPHIDEAIRSGQQVTVKLEQPVPVYWVYITAWAYPSGIVEFRNDIYQRDGFSPAVTGSIGRPEPQDGVSKTSYDQGDPDGALEPGPDDR